MKQGQLKGITFEVEDPNDDEMMMEVTLRTHFVLCSTCQGSGVSTGGLVFTQSDFEEDPDLRESLVRGDYDRQCHDCGGLRVTEEVDEDDPHYEAWCRYEQAGADLRAEEASERRYCYGY